MAKLVPRFDKSGATSLVSNREWIPLRFSDCTEARVVNRDGTPLPVFDSFSVSGNQNVCTLNVNKASLSSGTGTANTGAATFKFPVFKSNGEALQLDEPFAINFYIKTVSTTASSTTNDTLIAVGLFDGDLTLQGGRIATGLHYNNNTGPRLFSAGNGLSITAQQTNGLANLEQASFTYRCESFSSTRNVIESCGIALTSTGDYQTYKRWEVDNAFLNSKVMGQAYVGLWVGRSAANANNPVITFEAYYSLVEPPTYEGVITGIPTVE